MNSLFEQFDGIIAKAHETQRRYAQTTIGELLGQLQSVEVTQFRISTNGWYALANGHKITVFQPGCGTAFHTIEASPDDKRILFKVQELADSCLARGYEFKVETETAGGIPIEVDAMEGRR